MVGCRELEVLELSEVKVSDDGLRILLYYPLEHLRELDLSSTEVTVQALELLPTGGCGLPFCVGFGHTMKLVSSRLYFQPLLLCNPSKFIEKRLYLRITLKLKRVL